MRLLHSGPTISASFLSPPPPHPLPPPKPSQIVPKSLRKGPPEQPNQGPTPACVSPPPTRVHHLFLAHTSPLRPAVACVAATLGACQHHFLATTFSTFTPSFSACFPSIPHLSQPPPTSLPEQPHPNRHSPKTPEAPCLGFFCAPGGALCGSGAGPLLTHKAQ